MTQPADNVATIEEYSDVWEFRDRARQMTEWGWHPLSVSTTLSRTLLTYVLLGLGPRASGLATTSSTCGRTGRLREI